MSTSESSVVRRIMDDPPKPRVRVKRRGPHARGSGTQSFVANGRSNSISSGDQCDNNNKVCEDASERRQCEVQFRGAPCFCSRVPSCRAPQCDNTISLSVDNYERSSATSSTSDDDDKQSRRFFIPSYAFGSKSRNAAATMAIVSVLFFAALAGAHAEISRRETAYACEGKTLTIECRNGEVIDIIRANYGRYSITICNDRGNTEWSVNCMSNKSIGVMRTRCGMKQNCSVLASTNTFGDPCRNTLKYLEAHYRCIPANTSSSTVRPSPPWRMTSPPSVWRIVPTSIGAPAGTGNGAALAGSAVEKPRVSPGVRHEGPPTVRPTITMPPDLKPGVIKQVKNDGHSPEIDKSIPKLPKENIHPVIIEEETSIPEQSLDDNTKTIERPKTSDKNDEFSKDGFTENPKKVDDDTSILGESGKGKNVHSQIPPFDEDREHATLEGDGNKRHHHHNHHESPSGVPKQPLWRHCPPQIARDLQWNWTSVDEVTVQPCPGGATGLARWRCVSSAHRLSHLQQQRRLGSPNKDSGLSSQSRNPIILDTIGPDTLLTDGQPVWISENPDLSECRSVWLNNLEMRVKEGEGLLSISNDLTQVTSSKTLYGGDMMTTTNIIKKLAQKMSVNIQSFPDTHQKEEIVTDLLLGVVKTGSNLLDITQQASWKDLSHPAQMRVATSLLIGIEENAFLLAGAVLREKTIIQHAKNILLSVRVLETRNVETEEFPSFTAKQKWTASQDVIYLPRGALIDNSEGGLVRIVFVAFDRLEEILQPPPAPVLPVPVFNSMDETFNSEKLANARHQQMNSEKDRDNITRVINSKVISASLGKGRHIQLSQPVRLTLRHLRTENVTNPTCVFWDYTVNVWSTEGCHVEWTNFTHTGCQCTHLTNFALLMDVHSVPLSAADALALSTITLVGCSISAFALTLTIIMFCCIGGMKSDRVTIHKNLCVCLLTAELIFIFGIEQTANRIVCGVIAAFLHYFFLAAFAWMSLEGYQLYAMLIEVFEPEKPRARWYYFFGYVTPLVIVGISSLVDYRSYGTSQHCWLRTDNFFHLWFIVPVALVILINWLILVLVIYKMCGHPNVSIKTKENSKIYKIRVWLRSSMMLAVLLGLTWTFGLLYINQETKIMAYIFTILNSLQGVFIFISQFLQNEKFQKECGKLASRHPWLSCCLKFAPSVPTGPAPATASSSAQGSSQQCPQPSVPITTQSTKHPRYHRDNVQDQCLEDVSERDHSTRYTLKQQQLQESPKSWNNATMIRPSAPPLLQSQIDSTSTPHSLSMPSIHNSHSGQIKSHNHGYQHSIPNRTGTPVPVDLQHEYPSNIDVSRSRSPSCFSVKMGGGGNGNGEQNNGWGVVQNPLSSAAVSSSWKNTSSKHQQPSLVGTLQHPDHSRRIDTLRACQQQRYDNEINSTLHSHHPQRNYHPTLHTHHGYADAPHYYRGNNQEFRAREEPEYEEIDRNETLISDMSDDNSGQGDRCILRPDLSLQGGSYLHGDSRPLISYSPGESQRYDHSPVALDHQIPHGRYNINRWDSLERHSDRGYHPRETYNPRTLAAVLNRENNVVCHVEPHVEALYPGHGHMQRTVLPPYSDC